MNNEGYECPRGCYSDPEQIIPANGWKAVFYENGTLVREPLVCWAIVPFTIGHETDRKVCGMFVSSPTTDDMHTPQIPDEIGSFLGYEPPNVELDWSGPILTHIQVESLEVASYLRKLKENTDPLTGKVKVSAIIKNTPLDAEMEGKKGL